MRSIEPVYVYNGTYIIVTSTLSIVTLSPIYGQRHWNMVLKSIFWLISINHISTVIWVNLNNCILKKSVKYNIKTKLNTLCFGWKDYSINGKFYYLYNKNTYYIWYTIFTGVHLLLCGRRFNSVILIYTNCRRFNINLLFNNIIDNNFKTLIALFDFVLHLAYYSKDTDAYDKLTMTMSIARQRNNTYFW
jgi:hypothetical protein